MDNLLEKAALAYLPGITRVHLYGVNGSITTTDETLWDESNLYAFRTAGASMTVSSASANDTSAGTGARTVSITGVNASYVVVTETATLNGTTGVALTNTYLTVTNIEVLTAGSGGSNAGILYVGTGTVTAGKPATVDGLVAAGYNKSSSLIYCVPVGYSLLIYGAHSATRSVTAGGHEFSIQYLTSGSVAKKLPLSHYNNTSGFTREFEVPLVLPASTQVQGLIQSNAGTGPAWGALDCILAKDSESVLWI